MTNVQGISVMVVDFTNWRGERRTRRFLPTGAVEFGSTNWHPEPHYYMPCLDMETGETRDCPLANFHMETLKVERQ